MQAGRGEGIEFAEDVRLRLVRREKHAAHAHELARGAFSAEDRVGEERLLPLRGQIDADEIRVHDAHVRSVVFVEIQPLALERRAPVEAEVALDDEGIDHLVALIEPVRLERGIADGVVRALDGVEGVDARPIRHADDEERDEEREAAEDQQDQQQGVHGELWASHFFLKIIIIFFYKE